MQINRKTVACPNCQRPEPEFKFTLKSEKKAETEDLQQKIEKIIEHNSKYYEKLFKSLVEENITIKKVRETYINIVSCEDINYVYVPADLEIYKWDTKKYYEPSPHQTLIFFAHLIDLLNIAQHKREYFYRFASVKRIICPDEKCRRPHKLELSAFSAKDIKYYKAKIINIKDVIEKRPEYMLFSGFIVHKIV